MSHPFSPDVWEILACPYCGGALSRIGDGARCMTCQETFGCSPSGQLDLRLRKPKMTQVQFPLDSHAVAEPPPAADRLRMNPHPDVEWSVLMAQADMALFPRLPRLAARAVILPAYLLHRLWWKVGYCICRSAQAGEAYRSTITTGAFSFVASKPA